MVNERTDEWKHEWMDKWMNEWLNESMCKICMNEWVKFNRKENPVHACTMCVSVYKWVCVALRYALHVVLLFLFIFCLTYNHLVYACVCLCMCVFFYFIQKHTAVQISTNWCASHMWMISVPLLTDDNMIVACTYKWTCGVHKKRLW